MEANQKVFSSAQLSSHWAERHKRDIDLKYNKPERGTNGTYTAYCLGMSREGPTPEAAIGRLVIASSRLGIKVFDSDNHITPY